MAESAVCAAATIVIESCLSDRLTAKPDVLITLLMQQQDQDVAMEPVPVAEIPSEAQFEAKITPAQIRAWVTSGQPMNLPGFQPQLLPVVHMGARQGSPYPHLWHHSIFMAL